MEKENAIAKRLFIISNKLKRYLDKKHQKNGLYSAQARILMYLYRNGDKVIYQKDIEHEFQIRGGTVTGLIDGLVKMNLLDRVESDFDKRKRKIILTSLGKEKANDAVETIITFEDVLRNKLNKSESEILFKIIDKINMIIDEGEENDEII